MFKKKHTVKTFSGNFDDYELQPYSFKKMESIAHLIETDGPKNVPSNRMLYFDKHKERYYKEVSEEE